MTVVCDHGDRFFVVASQDSQHRSATVGFECNAIADAELQHGFVSVHLTYESEALHDAMIQVYKFSFGEMIYVDAIHVRYRVINTFTQPLCWLIGPSSDSKALTTAACPKCLATRIILLGSFDEEGGIISPEPKVKKGGGRRMQRF